MAKSSNFAKYGFTHMPENTMTLSDYKQFKNDLYCATSLDSLIMVKNKYNYPAKLNIKLLRDFQNPDKKENSISFNIDAITSKKYLYVGDNIDNKENNIFDNHLYGILYNHIVNILLCPGEEVNLKKLRIPVNTITKLLLFCHGDYSSLYNKELSDLTVKFKDILNTYGRNNILIYTYDVNELILPDFSSKYALTNFVEKFGKFDAVAIINCFNPKSFDYGPVAKQNWKTFTGTEFVTVINNIVNANGYIFTYGATMDGECSTFIDFYRDNCAITTASVTSNPIYIIDLCNAV